MAVIKRVALRTATAAIALVAFVSVAQARLAQLDPSFGRGGIDVLGATRFSSDVAVLRNGSILVAEPTATNPEKIELARYHRDGSIDRSFGSHGTVITSLANVGASPTHIVLAPRGKILVVGTAFTGSTTSIVLVRYRRNGSLDPSFGSGGILRAPSPLGREGTSALVQHDGKIVVGSANQGFVLLRYDANGKSLDPTFDGDGVAGVPGDRGGCGTSSQDGTHDIRIVSGDSIVADGDCGGGNSTLPLPYAGALRFSIAASGNGAALDTGFGSGGAALVPFSRPNFDAGLAQRPDGALVQLVQIGYGNVNARVGLAAYTSGGLLDGRFGAGGQVSFDLGTTSSDPVGMRLAPNGKIIVAATDGGDNGTFALVRRSSNGSADPKFAPHDRVLVHVGRAGVGDMSSSGASALTMQTDGKVIELGTAHVHGQTVAVLVRFGRAPRLSSVHLGHRDFTAKAGTRIRYRDSQAATTSIRIFRHGSLVRGFTHRDRAGSDRVHLDTHGLAGGRYRVTLTPVADGITGSAAGAGFRVS